MNKYRKYITSGVGFTFLIVGVSGVIMQFFFKNQVINHIHAWLGIGMFVFAVVHILQNWSPMKNHLKDWRVFLLLIPVVITVAFTLTGGREERRGMNPRELMSKLSQAKNTDLAKVFGKNFDSVAAQMKSDGLQVDGANLTVQQLAQNNHQPTDRILSYFVK